MKNSRINKNKYTRDKVRDCKADRPYKPNSLLYHIDNPRVDKFSLNSLIGT